MSESQTPSTAPAPGTEAMLSALFAQLVMQQSNLAMMLLGKMPHPETGQATKDLESAKLFIDTLEMLEAKTRGNLSKQESALLKQSLMSLRLAFVEAVEASPAPAPATPAGSAATGQAAPGQPAPASPPEEEHQKKFSKKY